MRKNIEENFKEVVYLEQLSDKFACLKKGTLNTKAHFAKEITILLNPCFITDIKNPEKLQSKFKKIYERLNLKYFQTRLDKRKKENVEIYEKHLKEIVEFLEKNKERIAKEEEFKVYSNDLKDLINNKFMVANSDQVFTYDTTSRGNFHLTMLIDIGTRLIVSHKSTKNMITGEEIKEMIGNYLSPAKIKKQGKFRKEIIIHSDKAGNNISNEVRDYSKKNNIRLSYTEGEHGNNVSEVHNKIFFDIVARIKLREALPEESFFDLTFEHKQDLTKHVILIMNNRVGNNIFQVPGNISLLKIAQAKMLTVVSDLVCARKDSTLGRNIIETTNLMCERLEMIEYQRAFRERTNITLYAEEPKIRLIETGILNDRKAIQKERRELSTRREIFETVTAEVINAKDLETNIILIKAKIQDKLEKASTTEEKDKLLYEQSIIELLENQKSSLDKQTQLLKESEKREVYMLKQIEKSNAKIEELLSIIKKNEKEKYDQRTEKETKAERRRLNKFKQIKERYSILPEDFNIIFSCINGKIKYVKSRDRLAHTILKLTGIRISNLKYVTLQQLDNLFHKGTMFIRPIKSQRADKMEFPYVKEMERYLKNVREDYEYIKEYVSQKSDEIYDKLQDLEGDDFESEIWSTRIITRETLNKRINTQLRIAGQIINKRITSHSYRRGVAILTAKMFGIFKAKHLLNHSSISTTQLYMQKELSKKEVKTIYSGILSIKDTKDIENKTNFDDVTDFEISKTVDKIMKEEEY